MAQRRPLAATVVLVGFAVGAVAFALAGNVVLAIVCVAVAIPAYLQGYAWAPLSGKGAYLRRASRVWSDAMRALESAEARWERSARQRVTELADLEPPVRLRDRHRELVAHVDEAAGIRAGGFPGFASRAVPWLQRREQLRHEWLGMARDPEELRYTEAVEQLFVADDEARPAIVSEEQRLLTEALGRLERMRAPADLVEQHDRLVATLKEYIGAERDFYETIDGDGPELATTAQRVEAAATSLDRSWERSVEAQPS